MDNKIKFKITTPEGTVFTDEVDEVILPTPKGEIGILPGHIPLVSLLSAGEVRIKKGNEETSLAVSGGYIEVQNDQVTVLADTAERAEEINVERAEAGRQRAEELMKQKIAEDVDYTSLVAKMEKELARLRVARKKKYRDVGRRRPEQPKTGK